MCCLIKTEMYCVSQKVLFRIMMPEKDFGRTLARLHIKEFTQDGKISSLMGLYLLLTHKFIALGFKSISRAVFGEEVKYKL